MIVESHGSAFCFGILPSFDDLWCLDVCLKEYGVELQKWSKG